MVNNLVKKIKSIGKSYYSISDLENISGLNRKSLLVKLNRMQKRDEIERLFRGYYILEDQGLNLAKIITQIFDDCYISFESALGNLGILNQKAYTITLATIKKPKRLEIAGREVEFRRLKKEFFFGYRRMGDVYIAEPEKALLDQLYLVSKGKATLDWDELNLKNLKKTVFLQYARKFPKPTQRLAKKLVKNFGKTSVTIK